MKRGLMIFLFFLTGISVVHAILPPDAAFKKRDIFEYRQRKMAEYQRAEQRHETSMVVKDQAVRKELSISPWSAAVGSAGASRTGVIRAAQHRVEARQRSRKWVFSTIALLLIGGWVWWVKISTESESGE